jgi:hypothetical protein
LEKTYRSSYGVDEISLMKFIKEKNYNTSYKNYKDLLSKNILRNEIFDSYKEKLTEKRNYYPIIFYKYKDNLLPICSFIMDNEDMNMTTGSSYYITKERLYHCM